MPLPGHRLDLLLVGVGEGAEARAERAWAELGRRGVVDREGWADRKANWLIRGGFSRGLLDIRERPRLWANQAGGFKVACPQCATGLVRELAAATDDGSPVGCPSCGASWAIDALSFAPPAAWGRAALVLRDVEDASLTEEGAAWAADCLGNHRVVWRRP